MSFENRGFTLIEILVVIAIVGFVLSFGLGIDLSALSRNSFHTEEATIVSILERARSRAMANLNDSDHGVCYIEPDYVIFIENEGHCVDGVSSNELISANTNIATASDFANPVKFPPVVFNRLAGTTSGAAIHIEDGVKQDDIIINEQGAINW